MSVSHFISHSADDSRLAGKLVEALENEGATCWIAPRNIPAGANYASAILQALEEVEYLVVLYSRHSSISEHVIREVEMALKNDVVIIPVRTDGSPVSGSLKYFLATRHWLKVSKDDDDITLVARAIVGFAAQPTNRRSRWKPRRNGIWIIAAAVAVVATISVFTFSQLRSSHDSTTPYGVYVLQTNGDKPVVLYETPNAHDSSVGRMKRGSKVFVEEVIEDSNKQVWYRITIEKGWLAAENFSEKDYKMVMPEGSKEFSIGQSAFVNYAGEDGLFLRASASIDTKIIAKLLQGTRLKVINNPVTDDKYQWIAVSVPMAWIQKNEFLTLERSPDI